MCLTLLLACSLACRIESYQQSHKQEFDEHVQIAHWRHFNSFLPEFQEGDVVLHVAGGILNRRKYSDLLAHAQFFNCRSRLWVGPCLLPADV